MTLTQLVDLKKRLEYFTTESLESDTKNLSMEINSWSNLTSNAQILESLNSYIKTFDSIDAIRLSLNTMQTDLLELVRQEIGNLSGKFLTLGYEINGQKALDLTPNADVDRQYRKLEVSGEFAEELGSRIRRYTNWKYPCVEIGPGDGFWTDNLVGSDPLYLVDIHKEYLDTTVYKYNDIFKRRIRPYLIGPESGKSNLNLDFLPDNQIGFIFSWAVFDFIPYEQTKIYLTSCIKSLRPGGVMLFSFNDCDIVKCAADAEDGARSWMTRALLSKIFNELNVECLGFYSRYDPIKGSDFYQNWVEIKKPGILKSMKTSQPLYTINVRPGFEKVDTEPERQYNKQQIARIKQLAVQLGIDTPEKIMGGAYSPHKLMKLVEIARMNK